MDKFEEYGIELEFEKNEYYLGQGDEYIATILCDVSDDAVTGKYEVIVTSRPLSLEEDEIWDPQEAVFTIHVVESSLDHPGVVSVILSVIVLMTPLVIMRRVRKP